MNGGPTESAMLVKIDQLVDVSDLESVTVKVIHKKLEDLYGQSLDKQIVKRLIFHVLSEQAQTSAVLPSTIY